MLENFKIDSLLSSRAETISKIFLGKVDNERALLILSKIPFGDAPQKVIREEIVQQNDIYTNGIVEVKDRVKYTLIHPAPDTIIKKYSGGAYYMKKESGRLYREKVLPLALSKGPNLKWVDNLFAEVEEKTAPCTTDTRESILHIDKEFIICLDLKWDQKSLDSLYLLVLFRDISLYTLRELRAEHLPLLERVKKAVEKALLSYSVSVEEVKMYFHYHPTFYRLHLHASAIKTTWKGTEVGKSILLHDVVENLKISPSYYQERELEVCISSVSYLYEAFTEDFTAREQSK